MSDVDALFASYPRSRPPLPEAHRAVYVQEYQANREGDHAVEKAGKWLEAWLHRQVSRGPGGRLLELGAGSLNHVPYETSAHYDVVEPFTALYEGSPHVGRVNRFFASLAEVPPDERYDRILSVAVLEHLEDLPGDVARSGLLLAEGGEFRAGIPSEGGFLWGLAWRCTTGVSFRLRTGLPYEPLMRHEHINDAAEMLATVRYFFEDVRARRFPLPWHQLSFYVAVEARRPRRDRCRAFLEGRA